MAGFWDLPGSKSAAHLTATFAPVSDVATILSTTVRAVNMEVKPFRSLAEGKVGLLIY
jgi:hypothetical protein